MKQSNPVPVTTGSSRFRSTEVDGFRITDAWFPAGTTIAPHVHDRATFAVMLSGSFRLDFKASGHRCTPETVFTEPAGERHANLVGRAGARVVVVQPDPRREDLLQPCRALLDGIHRMQDAAIAGTAWRLVREIDRPDNLAPLSIESLVLDALAAAVRMKSPVRRERGRLRLVEEILQDRFLEPLTTSEIAREVNLHPAYLARVFRVRHRMTLAAYQRRLRLDWAARRLVETEDTLPEIAADAGFADQSHFTRAFKQYCGETPGRYRLRNS